MAVAPKPMVQPNYMDKVYGGWMGKNIGGTLGGPLEGNMGLLNYNFYPKLDKLPLANDDLDLQMVWLHALETYGARLTAKEIAQEWLDHVFFPYDEYGYGLTNMRRGMEPPVSGWYSNPFTDCMGSPIRSEIWAMVAPGQPEVAAYYAYQDAVTDHAGGEGVYGEMFFAAVESAAFVESDRDRLIARGLSVIPAGCRTAQAVQDTIRWYHEGLDWVENRQRIINKHGNVNFTDAPQNIAFTILGWLYGQDFGDAICKAVNCGYDTDCTGATLGAILGIIMGAGALPPKWVEPLGDAIVVSPPVKGFPAPRTVTELTERTAMISAEILGYWSSHSVPDLPSLWATRVHENRFYFPAGSYESPSLTVTVNYGPEGPVISQGQVKTIEVEMQNHTSVRRHGQVIFHVPANWPKVSTQDYDLEPGAKQIVSVTLQCGNNSAPYYQLEMEITHQHNDTVWQSYRQIIVLAQAMSWQLELPDQPAQILVCPTNRIAFEQAKVDLVAGVYQLSSHLVCPSYREARLIVGTASPVRVWLDGQPLLDSWQTGSGIPAYHRGRNVPITLTAGTHDISIQLEKRDDLPFELYIALVGGRNLPEPGSHFCYNDVMFI